MGHRTARRPARAPAVAVAVLLGVLSGCGTAAPALLDESARTRLQTQVENIRSALGDRARATAALDRFRAEVRRLRDAGDLAAADADVLLAHADQIGGRVRAESPVPRPTPVEVVQPPRADDAEDDGGVGGVGGDDDGEDAKRGKGKDDGKGKGNKKGGGDD